MYIFCHLTLNDEAPSVFFKSEDLAGLEMDLWILE